MLKLQKFQKLILQSLNNYYQNVIIVPISFRNINNQMIQNYLQNYDRIIIILSNSTKSAIIQKNLSKSNTQRLGKIIQFIKDNKIKQVFPFLKQIQKIDFDEVNCGISFDKLVQSYNKILELKENSKEMIQLKNMIKMDLNNLNKSLFSNVKEDNLTPQKVKQDIQNKFKQNGKLEVIISKQPSPFNEVLSKINKIENCNVFIGNLPKQKIQYFIDNNKNSSINIKSE